MLPNMLVTGTPGVGKSHLCRQLSTNLKLTWLDCSKIATERDFVEEYSAEYDCPTLDEDKLLDFMEPLMQKGNNIVEYHGCDFFPERWFRAVFVVTCPNTVLYDRLKDRGYNEKKLRSNVECEIFHMILDEAKDSYNPAIVHVLNGATDEDAKISLRTMADCYRAWDSSDQVN